MVLDRFLGGRAARPTAAPNADTETVRRIVGQLEALPPDRARYLAAFAYTLTRAAAADLEISEVESAAIETIVTEHGGLPEAQAVLVAQIAKTQQLLTGGSDDYSVTRQFNDVSTVEQRLELLRCCYLVGAADDTITAEESSTLQEIARELDLDRGLINAIRNEFAGKLSAIQALLARQGPGPASSRS